MEIQFETMISVGEQPTDLVDFFRQMLPEFEAAEWNGAMPRLFQRGIPTWRWDEILADGVREVSEGEAERLGLTTLNGDLAWRTATSGYLYAPGTIRDDPELPGVRWCRWEYHGARRGFGSQRWLPPECVPDPQAAGRLRVTEVTGTYGRAERLRRREPPLPPEVLPE